MSFHDDALFEEPCCACDQPVGEGGDHFNWIYLNRKAEWDFPAVGNVLHDIPNEYAMALVCDECIEEDRDPEWVLKGEDLERVDPDDLEELEAMAERAGLEEGSGR